MLTGSVLTHEGRNRRGPCVRGMRGVRGDEAGRWPRARVVRHSRLVLRLVDSREQLHRARLGPPQSSIVARGNLVGSQVESMPGKAVKFDEPATGSGRRELRPIAVGGPGGPRS